jgi:hypothetical protein
LLLHVAYLSLCVTVFIFWFNYPKISRLFYWFNCYFIGCFRGFWTMFRNWSSLQFMFKCSAILVYYDGFYYFGSVDSVIGRMIRFRTDCCRKRSPTTDRDKIFFTSENFPGKYGTHLSHFSVGLGYSL